MLAVTVDLVEEIGGLLLLLMRAISRKTSAAKVPSTLAGIMLAPMQQISNNPMQEV